MMNMEYELIKGGFPKSEILLLRRKFEAERTNQSSMTQRKEIGEYHSKQAY